MSHVLLVQADSRTLPLAERSVHCIVTSPPYWGLRDYGTAEWQGGATGCTHIEKASGRNDVTPEYLARRDALYGSGHGPKNEVPGVQYRQTCPCGATRVDAQLGMESLHDCLGWATGQDCGACYLCHMRAVMRECWRVLRNDGVMFVNIADSYNAAGRVGHGTHIGYKQGTNRASANGHDSHRATAPGLKPKDLCGIPQRLALALQADGWYWRSEIIWSKANPMPESVQDRPSRAHEHVLLFSKQERYFWDADAVRQPYSASGLNDAMHHYGYGRKVNGKGQHLLANGTHSRGGIDDPSTTRDTLYQRGGANMRTVWQLAPEGSTAPHFAVFPTELVRRCVLAGTSEYGVCSTCGTHWVREVHRVFHPMTDRSPAKLARGSGRKGVDSSRNDSNTPRGSVEVTTTGWSPSCTCDAPRAAAVVFDPFVGSGTTVQVACALGRDGIGTDLSYPYLHDIAQHRIAPTYAQPGLFEPRSTGVHVGIPQQTTLFGERLGKESA